MSEGSETLGMTSERFKEMFESYSEDKCAIFFVIVLKGGRVVCRASEETESRTPIHTIGNKLK